MSETRHDFHELMTDALDGRLGPADKERFERMLRDSDERAREWETFREMRERLVGIGTSSAPPEMFDRIAAAIRSEESGAAAPSSPSPSQVTPGPWSHFTRMGVGRAAAVLLAFAMIATILLNETNQDLESLGSQFSETADVEDPDAGGGADKLKEGRGASYGESEQPQNQSGKSSEGAVGRLLKPSLAEDVGSPPGTVFSEQGLDGHLQRQGELARFDKLKSTLDDYEDVVAGRNKSIKPATDARSRPGVVQGKVITALPRVGPDVMDEAMILIGKNLERFSPEELRSRGFDRFAQDADDLLTRHLGSAADGSFAGRKAAPSGGLASGGGAPHSPGRGARARGSRGRGGSGGRSAPSARGMKPTKATPGAAPGAGKSERSVVEAVPEGIAAPVIGGTRHERKMKGQARERAVPPVAGGGRVFLALLGEGASVRARALLEEVAGVRGQVVRRAFASSKATTPAPKEREDGSRDAATNRDRSIEKGAARSTSGKADAPVYSIFEVTLPVETANALVGRLESEKGLALRSLGKSLLPTLAGGPRISAGGVLSRGANSKVTDSDSGPRRTLVLVVFER